MKAIVLSYDKNRCLTEHMIYKYMQLWPDNPFIFRIPCQTCAGIRGSNREYIESPSDIKGTVLSLLSDLDGDEWIYWCIDDKYPINLDLHAVRTIIGWIDTLEDTSTSGILFCRPDKLLKDKFLTGDTLPGSDDFYYLERNSYKRIWLHQFLRVKVLKHLFSSFPDAIPAAKHMDALKSSVQKPHDHKLYLTSRNLAVFGESSSRGMLTENCYHSILQAGLELPAWFSGKCANGNIHGRM